MVFPLITLALTKFIYVKRPDATVFFHPPPLSLPPDYTTSQTKPRGEFQSTAHVATKSAENPSVRRLQYDPHTRPNSTRSQQSHEPRRRRYIARERAAARKEKPRVSITFAGTCRLYISPRRLCRPARAGDTARARDTSYK